MGKRRYAKKKTNLSTETRIYPTRRQKRILKIWINDARTVYNFTVQNLKGETGKTNKYDLRNRLVIKKNTELTDEKMLKSMERTPKDIRAKATFEACTAHDLSIKKSTTPNPKRVALERLIKIEEKKIKKNESLILKIEKLEESLSKIKKKTKMYQKKVETIEKYEAMMVNVMDIENLKARLEHTPKFCAKTSNVKYRNANSQYQHIFIPKTTAKVEGEYLIIYERFSELGRIIMGSKNLEIEADFQIRWNTRLDSWSIITSEMIECQNPTEIKSLISIDPGIRIFLTGVDHNGDVYEIGKDWSEKDKIRKRMHKLDKCKASKIKGKRGNERYNVLTAKRRAHLHSKKIHNLIDDMHKRVSRDLLSKYDAIILPKLNTKSILKHEGGLGNNINRKINILSHGKFHDYISWKAKTLGKVVINQDESYTTKTCYQCGFLNDIGSSKLYVCKHCGHTCDRDIQSSLNILTRFMSSYSSQIGDCPDLAENYCNDSFD